MTDSGIDKAAFVKRFRKAVESATRFATTMVRQPLPDSWWFVIEPNASYDGHHLVGDECLYPDDSLPQGDMLGPMTFEQAAAWLWRERRVPEWVDVSVHGVNREHTYVRLICCGRFTGMEERLYYRNAIPPFGIKSPVLPFGWESVEVSGRFDLPTIG